MTGTVAATRLRMKESMGGRLCHSGAPRSGEPGIHNPDPSRSTPPVVMDPGLPRFTREAQATKAAVVNA
jgi:hypothetical protein